MSYNVLDRQLSTEQHNAYLTVFVKQYLKFLSCGKTPGEAFELLAQMGYTQTKRSLDNHVKLFLESGRAIREAGAKRGPKRLLNEDQERAVKAHVVNCKTENNKTNHRKLIKFIKDTMTMEVSMATLKRIEKRNNISKRTISKRCQGAKLTADELVAMYWEWILVQRKSKIFCRPLGNIFSFDVTTTKPPEKETTLAVDGSGKVRSTSKVTINTDAIVTIISAAGGNPCPCVLFTSNVRLSLDQKNTPRGKAITANLWSKFKEYDILPSRVIFEKGKPYTPESPERYIQVTKKYLNSGQIPEGALICHDGGNAFKPAGVSIFDELGLEHLVYPSAVHQYLSPNDNKIHGCKSKWYTEYEDLDDVCRSLRLMQLIDQESERNAKTYFKANIFNLKKSDLPGIVVNRDRRAAKDFKFKHEEDVVSDDSSS